MFDALFQDLVVLCVLMGSEVLLLHCSDIVNSRHQYMYLDQDLHACALIDSSKSHIDTVVMEVISKITLIYVLSHGGLYVMGCWIRC